MLAHTPRDGERGQVLAIFGLSLVAIVTMTGLVIDGGSTFVQRRDMQNAADAAAMAAGYAWANTTSSTAATAAAQAAAASNGYLNGVGGVVVNVTVNQLPAATTLQVDVRKPHRNAFSGIVGLSSWDVSTSAKAVSGPPNVAVGVAPIIFNDDAVAPDTSDRPTTTWFTEPPPGNADIPLGLTQFNWTLYCTNNGANCNGDSNNIDELVVGTNESGSVVTIGDTSINPLNAGSHATLFSTMTSLIGECFAVGVVDDAGIFQGVAMFCLTGSVGGATKSIGGYFTTTTSGGTGWQLRIDLASSPSTSSFGNYVVYLID
jgi:hypothetical protein